MEDFSAKWGRSYLVASQAGTDSEILRSRACGFNPRNAQNDDNTETTKVFPIKPKDHRRLIRIWFQNILPALPRVLSESLGGSYTASLVRRGQNSWGAEPCIQIESPRIPGSKAQQVIKDFLNEIYKQVQYAPIAIRFLQGSVKKLNKKDNDQSDNEGENAEDGRLEFNLLRPFSRLRMGASLSLKCSKKLMATVGGFVQIDGKKYMLTSEHFVAQSQEPENVDTKDDADLDKFVSPSRHDLIWMENNLKQNKRDVDSRIDSWIRKTYGDQDIAVSDQITLPTDLDEDLREVMSLLKQVTRPLHSCTIGTVRNRSAEPRRSTLASSVADIARLEDDQRFAFYHMDWCLCELDSKVAQTSENQHKYRSNQDAMADRYTEEENRVDEPGEVCHETCDVESGTSVYYVGRGSKHMKGIVTIPSLVSRESSVTLDWGIMSSDGQKLHYEYVAGDSGAWVIREVDHKLMGQVHSYSSGQVLFTPINVIFDDIRKDCEVDVGLPPRPPGSGQIPIAVTARPLCARGDSPTPKPFKFLMRSSAASEPQELVSPIKVDGENGKLDTDNQAVSSPLDEPPCTPPSLSNSPRSSVSTFRSPETPPPLEIEDLTDNRVDVAQQRSQSLPSLESINGPYENWSKSMETQNQLKAVQLASEDLHKRNQIRLRFRATARISTWPTDRQGRNSKASWQRLRSVQLSVTPDSAVSVSSAMSKIATFARKMGIVFLSLFFSHLNPEILDTDILHRRHKQR